MLLESRYSIVAQYKPQFESPEATAQRDLPMLWKKDFYSRLNFITIVAFPPLFLENVAMKLSQI